MMNAYGLGLFFWVFLYLLGNRENVVAWEKLRKELYPPDSLETWRRKVKIALCSLLAFWFGYRKALQWADPLHDPFWRVRVWWHGLWIRKDEFHHSLDTDFVAMCNMTKLQQERYQRDLVNRRNIAHERDLD